MKKNLLILLCLLCLTVESSAQDDVASALKQINAIKSDTKNYLYAESTTSKWEEAYNNAKILLETNIEDWARQLNKSEDVSGYVAKAGNSIFEIKTRRGNLYRAFLYVKKADIIAYSSTKELLVVPITEDVNDDATPENIEIVPTENKSIPPYQPSAFELDMMEVTQFSDIPAFFKQQGSHIAGYGKFATMPTSGDCFIFVYNKSGGISAYLKRKENNIYNIRDGAKDSIEEYKGCGAFWFIYK